MRINVFEKVRNILPKFMRNKLKLLKAKLNYLLRDIALDQGWIKRDDYYRPYIIEKSAEGVDFLFHIQDKHSRLWYDLYSTDPIWMEMAFIRDNMIEKGGVVIECGAHHGATAIMLSRWIGASGKVYAYEPGQLNYQVLEKNLRLNDISNVIPVQAAVGAEDGFISFDEDPIYSMGSSVALKHSKSSNTVRMVSLHAHLDECPSLIKIDTQGYVYQPLLGLKEIIKSQRPHLALEIDGKNTINLYGDNFSKIFEIINHEDYDYYVAFSAKKMAKRIALENVVSTWEKLNGLTGDIHLFAKNRNRLIES